MSNFKEEFMKAFRAARKVQIGSVLYVGNTAHVEPRIKRALRRGATVIENGVSQWISHNVIFDANKSGSAAYTWRGDKVKHEKVLCTKDRDGKITMKTIGFCYLEWNA